MFREIVFREILFKFYILLNIIIIIILYNIYSIPLVRMDDAAKAAKNEELAISPLGVYRYETAQQSEKFKHLLPKLPPYKPKKPTSERLRSKSIITTDSRPTESTRPNKKAKIAEGRKLRRLRTSHRKRRNTGRVRTRRRRRSH